MVQFGIIAKSSKMQQIFQLINIISKTSTTVLLTGETGTGKELIAKTIHLTSNRCKMPFVAINCGAIPSELIESELFGHEKGTFTGAYRKTIGKFEYADGGTIFLDEIATLPMPLQVKLLRVLQEQSFSRIGSNTLIKVDIRFISATNVNLYDEIKKGNFREDLYYRLKVLPIEIPPLRERKEDIPLLIQHFLKICGDRYNKRLSSITDSAMNKLLNYSWPGNVRELQNFVELLFVLAKEDGQIDSGDLPKYFFLNESKELTYSEALKCFTKEYIIKMLESSGWNKNATAKKMNIHRNTLLNKIKELGIKND